VLKSLFTNPNLFSCSAWSRAFYVENGDCSFLKNAGFDSQLVYGVKPGLEKGKT